MMMHVRHFVGDAVGIAGYVRIDHFLFQDRFVLLHFKLRFFALFTVEAQDVVFSFGGHVWGSIRLRNL